MKLIKLRKFEIVERSMLTRSWASSNSRTPADGRRHHSATGQTPGVEAIVTGTLVELQGGKIDVNARLIKTETAQAIGAAEMTVKRTAGDVAAPAQPQTQAQPRNSSSSRPITSSRLSAAGARQACSREIRVWLL